MSIRTSALLACVTGMLALIWPLRTAIETLSKIPLQGAFVVILMLSVGILGALMAPVFYFALWRNKAPLAIDRSLRNLALIAAIIEGVLIAISAQSFIASVNQYLMRVRAFGFGMDPESIQFASSIVGEASNVALVLLLIAFYKAPHPESNSPQSGFLEIASRVAVMICGFLLVLTLLQTGYTPYLFWEHRDQLMRGTYDQQSQLLRHTWIGQISRVLATFCLFVAPYVVCMSRRLGASQVSAETSPQENQPGIEALDQPR